MVRDPSVNQSDRLWGEPSTKFGETRFLLFFFFFFPLHFSFDRKSVNTIRPVKETQHDERLRRNNAADPPVFDPNCRSSEITEALFTRLVPFPSVFFADLTRRSSMPLTKR
ncbi:hypothetical protein K0M31_001436 [Melipona bicolor]|uniref:Uncharacterized protein n=1 Tax=Melipona bicolor TaxID=60889 RepID=A0AA40GFM9_9HYME|nr:hypothetical protein K0M31_001436 [Melipona bicolor]